MTFNLLATKLHRPAHPAQWVQRPYLTQRLQEGLVQNRQLTLVSAPAGFGKTTCVTAGLHALEGWPVTWLSLDIADNDPGRFFAYFIVALQKIEAPLAQEMMGMLEAGQLPPAEIIGTTLINEIIAVFFGQYLAFYITQRFGATAFSLTAYIIPVVAAITGVILLGETITIWMLIGMLLVALGIMFINRQS